MADFTIIILTLNEELHLQRLLTSLQGLQAPIFVLDSGSTDRTLAICKENNILVEFHAFENHPKQWHQALNTFPIYTPWVIGLDADQTVTPELHCMLSTFRDEQHQDIDGIYFNRKNIFRGKWVRHGGYYPVYLLKMFRRGVGYSDLTEKMDHRFIVPGKTRIWKKGHLLEENLKENKISFWIAKHNTYSDLLAREEIERLQTTLKSTTKPKFWGPPNAHKAWLKHLWRRLPRHTRAALYFAYRFIFRLGFLDGSTGILFHFLQAFWFRLIVDVKIEEHLKQIKDDIRVSHMKKIPEVVPSNKLHPPRLFAMRFLFTFLLLYGFNLAFIGLSNKGDFYWPILDAHLNYMSFWRSANITVTAKILTSLGYVVTHDDQQLQVYQHGGFKLMYSCIGYGLMSFFAAFVVSFPNRGRSKPAFLIFGLSSIAFLNILRLVALGVVGLDKSSWLSNNHHLVFNICIYAVLLIQMYYWANTTNLTLEPLIMTPTRLHKAFTKSGFEVGANAYKVSCWYLVSTLFFRSGLIPFSNVLVELLRLFGANIGKDVRIKPGIHIRYPWKLNIGDHSWLADCYIDNLDHVTIGKNVCVSQQAMLLTGNHNYKLATFDLITRPIVLGDGVWIGAKSLVLPGVSAFSHSVLTAGSTAVKTMDAYTIYQGNPAIKTRDREITDLSPI